MEDALVEALQRTKIRECSKLTYIFIIRGPKGANLICDTGPFEILIFDIHIKVAIFDLSRKAIF